MRPMLLLQSIRDSEDPPEVAHILTEDEDVRIALEL